MPDTDHGPSWLTPSERERLSESYSPWEGTDSAGPLLLSRLGTPVNEARCLADLLSSSLDPSSFGLPCLGIASDTRLRILISDFLVAASSAVVDALVTQFVAYRSWSEAKTVFANLIDLRRPGGPDEFLLVDDVPMLFEDYHRRNFFTATGSVLDNLAAVVIGVCGLPTSIRMASWARVLDSIESVGASGGPTASALDDLQISAAIERAGPPDWLRWAIDTRNMMVHRPTRLTMSRGADGKFLPRQPRLSDVEVMSQPGGRDDSWLAEESLVTMAGIRLSTTVLCAELSQGLTNVLVRRLSGELEIEQPEVQWSVSENPDSFDGYAPGSMGALDGAVWGLVPPAQGRRWVAAALMDDHRPTIWGG